MKKLLSFTLLLASLCAWAQNDDENNRTQHLLNSKFNPGIVYFKDGLQTTSLLNYSVITDKILYAENNEIYFVRNQEGIDRVVIDSTVLVSDGKEGFMQLFTRNGQSVFRKRTGAMAPAQQTDSYGGVLPPTSNAKSSETYSDFSRLFVVPMEYTVKVVDQYYIPKDGQYVLITTMKDIQKAFPDKANSVKDFIKKNKIRLRTPDDYLAIAPLLK